jgi:hypothetical protein
VARAARERRREWDGRTPDGVARANEETGFIWWVPIGDEQSLEVVVSGEVKLSCNSD